MAEFILHHYDTSPFSEKPRVMFGLKGLAWRSVIQPSIMPKPDLTPLTGGYRRAPVMQIGADIYCDTQIILRELDAKPAKNGFEGHHTVRIYNLLAHGPRFERVPVHPNVLPIVEGVLDRGCLV